MLQKPRAEQVVVGAHCSSSLRGSQSGILQSQYSAREGPSPWQALHARLAYLLTPAIVDFQESHM